METTSYRRAEQRIRELACRGLDVASFWAACTEPLATAVPHHLAPCWYTLDPASLLITSHVQAGLPELPAEWLAQEYYEDDVNKLTDVARSDAGVSTLHDATGGDPSRSPRWHENMRYGGDQEMITCLRSGKGEAWGAVGLYREPGQAMFSPAELGFMTAVAPHLAEGAKRGLLVGAATDADAVDSPDAPGVVVLRDDWTLESMTPGARRWLDELSPDDGDDGRLPASLYALAGQVLRRGGTPQTEAEHATVRVRSRSGRWLSLHGGVLVDGEARRAVIIVEPAHPARIAPLLMSAYGLTEREEEVTRLVLAGRSTTEIAAELSVSPHTVQEHLKRIFDKTGVRSRRDLVGSVFFAFYEPRVRDNERRAATQRPLRGEPLAAGPAAS